MDVDELMEGNMEQVGIATSEIIVVDNVATLQLTDELGRVFHSTLRELTPVEADAANS